MTTELRPHGTFIDFEYLLRPSDPAETPRPAPGAVEVTDEGRTRRYDKGVQASPFPQARGWIKQIYPDAIEYTASFRDIRGMSFMYAMVLGLPLVLFGVAAAVAVLVLFIPFEDWMFALALVFGILVSALVIRFGIEITSSFLQVDLFAPDDLPIIFDRKRRKVYRLTQEEQPTFLGMIPRFSVVACEYEWDLIDVEHRIRTIASGSDAGDYHFLDFFVRKSHDDASLIDRFHIANANVLNEGLVDPMWEHIRRFMEEDGPHLPNPNEPLATPEVATTWWESMGKISPFGPDFRTHWDHSVLGTAFIVSLFPVTLPIMLIWGTGHYLSFKTERPARWPKALFEHIGWPISVSATQGSAQPE